MAERTPAETLVAAVAKLRETAAGATRGPWVSYGTPGRSEDGHAHTITRPYCNKGMYDPDAECEPDCGTTVLTTGAEGCEDDNLATGDALWICLVHPGLADPLAAWLEPWTGIAFDEDAALPVDLQHALAVARAIVGPDDVATAIRAAVDGLDNQQLADLMEGR
uniref:hypothetical protein n=1 Tax=Herbidospora sakaeratensis TaxID=564415 RepID=UPI0007853FF1|nr:hypothetical protein [Herbidospora sakaeratensis]